MLLLLRAQRKQNTAYYILAFVCVSIFSFPSHAGKLTFHVHKQLRRINFDFELFYLHCIKCQTSSRAKSFIMPHDTTNPAKRGGKQLKVAVFFSSWEKDIIRFSATQVAAAAVWINNAYVQPGCLEWPDSSANATIVLCQPCMVNYMQIKCCM